MIRLLGIVPLASLLLVSSFPPAWAITVTTCNEANLRAAVNAGGTIRMACSGTIRLTSTLVISTDATLDATGQSVILDGGNAVRILEVRPGATLTVINLSIANGNNQQGAGLYVGEGAFVELRNCTFRGNKAIAPQSSESNRTRAMGGAVYNSGSLTLTGCRLVQNLARGGTGVDGAAGTPGAVYYDQFGRCWPSPFAGNGISGTYGGQGFGGAIYNSSVGALSLLDSLVETNTVEGGAGGAAGDAGRGPACSSGTQQAGLAGVGGSAEGAAVYNLGHLTISGCTIVRNSARGGDGGRGGWAPWLASGGGAGGNARGSAIWTSGDAALINSSVGENLVTGGTGGPASQDCSAPSWNGTAGRGEAGAVFNAGTFLAHHATIWNNSASAGLPLHPNNTCSVSPQPGTAGAASITASAGTTRLLSSIVGNPSSTQNCAGILTDGGYNICSDNSARFSAPTSRGATDPGLGSLGDYGGRTPTYVLFAASPAIDRGDPATCLPTDQRGFPRPAGNGCDIGAYEGGDLHPPIWSPSFSPSVVNGGAVTRLTFTFSNTNTISLNQFWFTNDLPPGAVVSSVPNGTLGCGGVLIGPVGGSRVIGRILRFEPGQSCTGGIDLRAVRYGVWSNNTLRVQSTVTGSMTVSGNASITVQGPQVETVGVAEITSISAHFEGAIDPHDHATSYYFEYGLTASFGSRTPLRTISGTGLQQVAVDQTGLRPGSTYHFQLVGYTSVATNHGLNFSFQTPSGQPEVETDAAEAGQYHAATLHGHVVPNGSPATTFFEYGTDTNYGHVTSGFDAGAGTNVVNVSAAVSGLLGNTTYHYRLVVRNGAGAFYGADRNFTTRDPAPSGSTAGAYPTNGTRWLLTGSANAGEFSARVWFDYGTTTNLGARTAEQVLESSEQSSSTTFSAVIQPPGSGGTLYFRLVASSPAGTAYGTILNFQTPAVEDGPWIFRLPEGWIKLRLRVAAGETVVLSQSADLKTWNPIATNSGPTVVEHIDYDGLTKPANFFRASRTTP